MKYITDYLEYTSLNELFVHGDGIPQNKDTVIAFRKDIWIVNDNTFSKYKNEIFKTLKILKEDTINVNSIKVFIGLIEDTSPILDVIIGTIINKNLVISSNSFYHSYHRHSMASTTLKKVLQELNLDLLIKRPTVDVPILTNEFKDDLREMYFYHGTSYSHLIGGIDKYGIKPNPKQNNYEIEYSDKVFVTLNIESAYGHAKYTSYGIYNISFPIIIQLKIPDVDKLVPDYDSQITIKGTDDPISRQLGYTKISGGINAHKIDKRSAFYKRQKDNKEDLIKKMGVFGYLGRIPTSHITNILYNDTILREYVKYAKKEISSSFYKKSIARIEFNNTDNVSDLKSATIKSFEHKVDELINQNRNKK